MFKIEKKQVRRPEWLKIKLKTNDTFQDTRKLIEGKKLNTVCVEARCPNIYECWSRKTATIMIWVIPVQELAVFVL